jgi:glucose/arabinose dehydrogenase
MKKILPLSVSLLLAFCTASWAQPKLQLVDFATGFDRPVDIAHCGDSRLFIVEQDGKIWVLDTFGNRLPEPFLDIDGRVNSSGNEQGLLGLAFPQDYAQSGHFFVYYTKNNGGDTRVARFSRLADNANKADPNSELTIIEEDQPFSNHNGGCIKFGPDGYLYIALGDGGSGGDPQNNGQKKNTLLGKILRINVNNSSASEPYVVPADNPFVNDPAYRPEIWSLGWRNPWRFSFDRLTGDMWIGDVGQGAREEIDFEPAGTGGRNYGWRCYEGTQTYNTGGCLGASNYAPPIFEYNNPSQGCSVTGGFVYRGTQYSDLYGMYLHADYCSGRIWGTRRAANGSASTTQLANLSDYEYSAFGEDKDGEMYVALLGTGKIQRVREICSAFQVSPSSVNSPVCAGSLSGWVFLETSGGAGTVSYLWSNSETTEDIVYLNPGTYIVVATDGNNCIRRDTFEIGNASPAAPILLSGDLVLCGDDSITLTTAEAPQDYGYQWLLNGDLLLDATDQTLVVQAPGAYAVQYSTTVGGACNSLVSSAVNIEQEISVPPGISAVGDSVFALQPCGNNCQWLLNGDAIPGATEPFYIAQVSGDYALQTLSDNGCPLRSTAIAVEVSGTRLPTLVTAFQLAPNPTQAEVRLSMRLQRSTAVQLRLLDKTGRQVHSEQLEGGQVEHTLDLGRFPAGNYQLQVQVGGETFVRTLVKL